jgi:hypothetical protein
MTKYIVNSGKGYKSRCQPEDEADLPALYS